MEIRVHGVLGVPEMRARCNAMAADNENTIKNWSMDASQWVEGSDGSVKFLQQPGRHVATALVEDRRNGSLRFRQQRSGAPG